MVYTLAGLLLAGYLTGFWWSRGEEAVEGLSGWLQPFGRLSRYLYKRVCIRKVSLPGQKGVQQMLSHLYPGKDVSRLYGDYCVRKLALSLAVVLAGTLLATLVCWQDAQDRILTGDGSVRRGEYAEGDRELELSVSLPELKGESFEVLVESRMLQGEELEEMLSSFLGQLPAMILGENDSLQQVWKDLLLEEEYGGYPFAVEWSSLNPLVIDHQGRVTEQEEAQEVVLEALISYGEERWEEHLNLQVVPPQRSAREELYRQLQSYLTESEAEHRAEAEWRLPDNWQGELLQWRELREDYGTLLWVLALGTAVLIFFLADQDLGRQVEQRKGQMKREYPELLHKLVLYLGAGLTIRGAFQRAAQDYEGKCSRDKRAAPLYEELQYACRELQAGVSEGAVYEHFGKRTGMQQYIRLSTLLRQNLKKGNSSLLDRLREEADKASLEQLQQGRKAGEEAATKLLVPMVMMLAIVMVIIMIPAFTSMGV